MGSILFLPLLILVLSFVVSLSSVSSGAFSLESSFSVSFLPFFTFVDFSLVVVGDIV